MKISLVDNKNFIWDYKNNSNIFIQGENGTGKTVALESIKNDISKQRENSKIMCFKEGYANLDNIRETVENEKEVFVLMDDISAMQENEKEILVDTLKMNRKKNMFFIITSCKEIPEELLSNCSLVFKQIKDTPYSFLTNNEEVIKFSYEVKKGCQK